LAQYITGDTNNFFECSYAPIIVLNTKRSIATDD